MLPMTKSYSSFSERKNKIIVLHKQGKQAISISPKVHSIFKVSGEVFSNEYICFVNGQHEADRMYNLSFSGPKNPSPWKEHLIILQLQNLTIY